MGRVVVDMSMSLDGFITGPDADLTRLHAWMSWDGATTSLTAQIMDDLFATTGASIMGRGMWDAVDGPNGWGPQGWAGRDGTPLALPVFVLTHTPRAAVTKGNTTFTFVNDGIDVVLARAQAAAGARNVLLQGAAIVQQYLAAGVVDELTIHLVPVLLGEGIRLFDHRGTDSLALERWQVMAAPGVTHLRFRVLN